MRDLQLEPPARTARALLVILATLAALACGQRPKPTSDAARRGYVTVIENPQASWVRNFNPFLTTARWPTFAGIYEPMLVYNTLTGEYVPFLAERYEFKDDNKKLVFHLRRGVTWSDGRPFTARDVVLTFSLVMKKPGLDRLGAKPFLHEFRALDDHTVEFSFATPKVSALYPLAQQPIVPEHVWKDIADPMRFANEEPVATGPFTRIEVFRPQIYEIGKNPTYWQKGKPAINGVRLPAFAANESATLAMLEGAIDWAGLFVPAVDRIYVGKNPEHFKYWFPLIEGTVLLYVNTTRAPFDDVRVRKALSLAIDRQRMVRVASFNYTRPSDATGLSDAFTKWRDPAIAAADWVAYDPPRAERLLDEAGLARGPDGVRRLPDGKPLDYEVNAVDGWTDWMRACQVIAKNLRHVGVQARVKTYSYGAYYDRLQRGEFDLQISWSFVGPTPYEFYRHLFSGELKKPIGEATDRNWHRFSVPGADELLATFDRSSNEAEQRKVAVQLQALFSEHAPAIPLFPSPAWGEYNDTHFVGFPNAADPYTRLSPFYYPENLLVLLRIAPRD